MLAAAGLRRRDARADVIGVELAGGAKNAAALAAAAAAAAGPNAAGAAAGKVFAEVDAYAAHAAARTPETFAGLAGAGDLVATVLAAGSRNRRAGELLAAAMPPAEIGPRSARPPRPSTRCRCSARAARRAASTRRPSTGLAAVDRGPGRARALGRDDHRARRRRRQAVRPERHSAAG